MFCLFFRVALSHAPASCYVLIGLCSVGRLSENTPTPPGVAAGAEVCRAQINEASQKHSFYSTKPILFHKYVL